MTPTQIVVQFPMAGSVMQNTLLASRITIQMIRAGYEPSMLQLISVTQRSCLILQIKFVGLQEKTVVSPTSFTMGASLVLLWDGDGESTKGLTNTKSTVTSPLRKRLTMMVDFFRYLC